MAGRVGDYLKVIRCSKGGYSDVPFIVRLLHIRGESYFMRVRKMSGTPICSLADSAYHGEACPTSAREHGAVPLHGIKKNARHFAKPLTNYQKMASFWRNWPNRVAARYGKRTTRKRCSR